MTVRQWKAPGKRPDVLLAALEHCRYATQPPPQAAQSHGLICHSSALGAS